MLEGRGSRTASGYRLAPSPPAGQAKGSDVLVSLQGFLTGLLSHLFNTPTSMALSQLVWQRNTDLNPHRTMQLALEAGMLNLSFEL